MAGFFIGRGYEELLLPGCASMSVSEKTEVRSEENVSSHSSLPTPHLLDVHDLHNPLRDAAGG